ncbi:hypothetical protein Pmar_PMAR000542 [Perkinsus marinus ATCC 50983]|uniref:Uncharacterized protein n=1 Tax=Perkinsus marinus (strain ATCC 50983 / TXsc) TaxID=423536 RepID=C5LIX0_PERM5|nr:hypothetical protein Pmar_PMAR000542 [Perkinsus marinus ATCC 50983]EER03305.1 hypothetical protein Pmar_PMAR000542 [Perkinsus marinus ATCC 50983]|eukprot:XP_002771489.1 hypothetical protein Pmar_PMAR000542 [Perkinsus marinus ATCC 50983]
MLNAGEQECIIPLVLACIWLAFKVTDSSEKYSLRMRDLIRCHNRWASAVRRVKMRKGEVGQVGGVTAVNPPEEEIIEKICVMEGVLLRISKCQFDNDWDRPGRALGTILASAIPVGVSPEVRKSVISKSYQLANSSYLSPKIVTQRSGELIGVACALLSFRLHGVTPVHQMDVVGGMYSTWYEPFLAEPCRAEEVEEVAREVVLAFRLNEKTAEITAANVATPPSSSFVEQRSVPQIANSSPLWLMKMVSELLFWPTFAWNYFLYVRSADDWYSDIADLPTGGKLLLGPAPVFASMREALVEKAGVTVFVSTLNREFGNSSVESRSFPMIDFVSPELHTVEAAVDYIDEQLEAGKCVYVHCKAGKGRSGTIVICWLMQHFRMSPEDAQEYLMKARPQVLKVLYKREVVREYYKKHVAVNK